MLKKLSLKNRNKKSYARPRKRALLAATALLASVVPVIATASPAAAVGEGITLSKTTATVTEAGGADTFTVVLDAQPSSNVVLQVVSADTGEATVSPSTLTFTNGNWDTPQTVTLTGANDSIIDGNVNSTITISVVDLLSDDNYDSIGDVTVTATTTDNEVAGFTKSQTARTVTEAGGTSTFTLVLDAQPDSNVVLNVVSADTGEVTVGTANYTFTSGNWDTAQTVTLTGVNDDLVDGSINTSVTISVVDESSDNNFDSVSDETVTVTTTDGDTAGFTIVETGSETSVTESGTSDTFTIVLDAAPPSSSVVLAISSGDTGEATVNPATLTFSTGNWNSAQTVTVTGVDDDIVDGSVNTAITISVNDASSDDSYDSLGNSTVTAATADNDNAGFTVAESSGSTAVTEAGGTDSFTVVLDKAPLTDVVLTVTSGDTGEATVSPANLTFTSGNWDSAQTVTVTGADDSALDGTVSSTITVAVNDGSSDDAFDSVADDTLTVTTTDNDSAGYTLSKTTATVTEAGGTDTFTVVLDAQPDSDVWFTITSGDTGEATVSSGSLTFTNANWDTAQTITITGANDSIIDGSINSTITIAVLDGLSNDNFDALADQTVTVTTTDNDTPGFTKSETARTVAETGSTATFTLVLDSQPDSDVVLNVVSADTGEVTVGTANYTFTNSNWDTPQTVTLTGINDTVVDVDTQTLVTISVTDGSSDDNFDSVANQTVTVTTTDNEDGEKKC